MTKKTNEKNMEEPSPEAWESGGADPDAWAGSGAGGGCGTTTGAAGAGSTGANG